MQKISGDAYNKHTCVYINNLDCYINLFFLVSIFIVLRKITFSDALLADLQNTVSPGSGGVGGSSPGYGSLRSTSRQSPGSENPASRSDAYNVKSVSFTF